MGLLHYSASDIIRSQNSSAIKLKAKDVKDADKNQDILLQGLKEIELTNKEIILDGHFVLLQNKSVTRLPISTYKSLGIKKIFLLNDKPEKIYKRILNRDKKTNLSIEILDNMQEQEIEYAQEISKLLGIELEVINVVDKSAR